MGGGGGDTRLIWDAFKRAGAHHLVVISAGDSFAKMVSYLEDFAESAYQPFETIQAFFISTEEQAEWPAIRAALEQPDTAVYFTGGDQTDYLDLFRGTNRDQSFITTINRLYNQKRLSLGGSSAGLAVQGKRAFHGPVIDQTGSRVLLDPNNVRDQDSFDRYVGFDDDFLNLWGGLGGPVLTETHFKERNRMPRFVAFLAQSQADIEIPPGKPQISRGGLMHGVAVDEGTALIVSLATGVGQVETTARKAGEDLPGYVFFARARQDTRIQFENGLSTSDFVDIWRVGANRTFNLTTWKPAQQTGGSEFAIKISHGRATSDGLLLSRDLYYALSYLDPLLLLEHLRNGQLIL